MLSNPLALLAKYFPSKLHLQTQLNTTPSANSLLPRSSPYPLESWPIFTRQLPECSLFFSGRNIPHNNILRVIGIIHNIAESDQIPAGRKVSRGRATKIVMLPSYSSSLFTGGEVNELDSGMGKASQSNKLFTSPECNTL